MRNTYKVVSTVPASLQMLVIFILMVLLFRSLVKSFRNVSYILHFFYFFKGGSQY